MLVKVIRDGQTMTVYCGPDHVAEYRLTPGQELSEMRRFRSALKRHFAAGGTVGNYQW